jgi:predicted RNase H-like nuclease (RuvC/YqgF family)
MTKTPDKIISDSLDVSSLLAELLRIQEERDRLWAEKELLREKLQLSAGTLPVAPVNAPEEDLPAKLGRLANELAAASRQLRTVALGPEKPAVDLEVERLQRHTRHLEHELAQERERTETLETELRVLEISARGKGGDLSDADIREQLAAALEREDQLLIRLHQMETTLAHRQADQLSLLEKEQADSAVEVFPASGRAGF